ncbi:hexitol phosphatase HxpB [Jiulongibacter sp. NS-SX5]|uniref:hexitol phosphatase HxpB n=1 Tax=Jiulongibacter sp. NS-SX5 TaxID=3463854 RepID=UPI0040593996
MIIADKIKAVIFDMDGLLVNSEPCWHDAEKIVFGRVGLELTTENCLETTGKPVKDVIQYWFEKRPWVNPEFDQMEADLFAEATKAIKGTAELMPGFLNAIWLAEQKGWKIGLASASPIPMIEMVLAKFELTHRFHFYHSAELEEFNKPHPAVYLSVAKRLQVPIENCLILEDSGGGVKGAVASRAQVIAVPSPHEYDEPKFKIANLRLRSLEDLERVVG